MAHRYAIYWAPPRDHPLWRAGCEWLGRDPETGEQIAPPLPDGMTREHHAEITRDPARYGWHGTLKPPFRLARGRSEVGLDAALHAFAASRSPFIAPLFAVRPLSGFLAVVPTDRSAALDALAAACVTTLDPFRAPPEPEEVERRRRAGLTSAQAGNLDRWGYPYVLGEFRFHLTLSARLDASQAGALLAHLAERFAPAVDGELTIDSIALYVEPEPGAAFALMRRYPFGHTPPRTAPGQVDKRQS
ncbi:DUF1045 domain-containing protein [Elioraea sp.]|uniref:DUF1045 domain-containing protein n=1 Tax=Elioraea sp. TaxID=2185103 RepID=UPI003F7094C0